MIEYTPYRITGHLVAVVTDADDIIMCYPNGRAGKPNRDTGKIPIHYGPGVIDAPTDEEKEFFALVGDKARAIPQDPRGFDVRDSNMARSFESSKRGREKGIMTAMSRESRKSKRKTSEPDEPETPEPDDEELKEDDSE